MGYISEKYGTQPVNIILIDEKDSPCDSGAFFSEQTGAVFITREHIADIVGLQRVVSGKSMPFLLNANEMAMIIGVEEGFHAHQFSTNPEYYKIIAEKSDALNVLHTSKEYNFLPIEYEAMQVVHQAMIDKGIVYNAPLVISNVSPETMQWAAPYLKERTIPANNITPFSRVVSISAEGAVSQTPARETALIS